MFCQTLFIALLYGWKQVRRLLLKLETYIIGQWDSCLAINRFPTKESGEIPEDIPCTLKENKLCTEIYKTLNNLNPNYMKQIFELRLCARPAWEQYKLNLNIPRKKKVAFWTKSLGSLSPKIWNNIPYQIKSARYLNIFEAIDI